MTTIDSNTLISALVPLINWGIPIIIGIVGATRWAQGNHKVGVFADAFNRVVAAARNGQVSETDFQAIVNDAEDLVSKHVTSTTPVTSPPPSAQTAPKNVSVSVSDTASVKDKP